MQFWFVRQIITMYKILDRKWHTVSALDLMKIEEK